MSDDQRHGRIFGVLFIITFITSIPALALFQPVLDDPAGYIAGGGKDNQIYLGAFLEFFLVVSNVGTAVVLYPIARRQNEALAIGYVAARIIESVFIAVGIIFVLGVVSMRQDAPGARRRCLLARRAEGLDVPLRPRTHRSVRKRTDPRLPDVQVGARPTAHGLARNDRRAAPLLRELGRPLRLVGAGPTRCRLWPLPEIIWEAVHRHLLRDLGFQAGLADRPPELARRCSRLSLSQPQWQRLLALSGVAFAVLFLIGWFASGGDAPDYGAADRGLDELGG